MHTNSQTNHVVAIPGTYRSTHVNVVLSAAVFYIPVHIQHTSTFSVSTPYLIEVSIDIWCWVKHGENGPWLFRLPVLTHCCAVYTCTLMIIRGRREAGPKLAHISLLRGVSGAERHGKFILFRLKIETHSCVNLSEQQGFLLTE